MKYTNIILILVLAMLGIMSCNRDEVFEKEQYKNVFSLISGSDNVSIVLHDLRQPESVGYVAASLGGTNPTSRDITVSMVEDQNLIAEYNKSNFDVNVSRYIQALSADKYSIDNYQFIIPAGSTKGVLPIRVRPDGLSPDSSYFVALKIDEYSSYEVNPVKDFVLYQVRIKNWWAAYGGTTYTMRSKIKETDSTIELELPGTKKVYPLSDKKVRLLAGSETNNNYAIVLTIGDDDNVTISPYKDITVTQLYADVDFPNIVTFESSKVNKDRNYKTFLLHYSYVVSSGKTYEVKEELRLEYKDDLNDPRFLEE